MALVGGWLAAPAGAQPAAAPTPNGEPEPVHDPPTDAPAVEPGPTAAPDGDPPPGIEVIEISGKAPSVGAVREQSAEAVNVVETERARRESADMGEVLARTEGVGVRRSGGLGSGERVSLAGFSGEQLRIFVDGIPLEMTGFSLGLGNIPVNLIERIEIYRGVVPIRFGADALGGAFNLVTDFDAAGTRAAASYQLGSFGTHRLSASARHRHRGRGLSVRAEGFGDVTANDYPVHVEVPDERGRLSPATVRRFHDGYRAAGGGLQVGVTDRPGARQLLLQVFATDYDKELQHNTVMSVPYGEVTYGGTTLGGTLRYEQRLHRQVRLDAALGYAFRRIQFRDVSEWVYDWYGQRVRQRAQPGEMESRPRDQVYWQHGALGRVGLAWSPAAAHELRLAVSPTLTTRTGDERRQLDPNARDPLTADRSLTTVVTGLEHEAHALAYRLENIAFAKSYLYAARTEEPLPGGTFRRMDQDAHRFGVGDALRYRLTDGSYLKASYEWATRLPRPDEVFGDGVLVAPNLALRPETSHNVNVGGTASLQGTRVGSFRAELTGFGRFADQLIVLLGNDRVFGYQNVHAAHALGVEAAAGWSSPLDRLHLDANATWQDVRNASSEGTFGDFAGDRIPNRPYLFANGAARLVLPSLLRAGDELALLWTTRYVHAFFRGWESVGLRDFKQTIPAQLLHAAGITYLVRTDVTTMTSSFEVQNLTDARAFDFYGMQRPGRAFFFKITLEYGSDPSAAE